mmetsp:Transcript_91707/g.290987  ORF Transcript_91707/g.290987 Transcript_91707/m.290987 type:complete len:130 (-) Transcript_91707:133-522(-)
MFVAMKGSQEAAEEAVCKKLQERAPEFAQLLYPHKAAASSGGSERQQIDPETGRVSNKAKARQHIAAIMVATQGQGGCPAAAGASGGGAAAAAARKASSRVQSAPPGQRRTGGSTRVRTAGARPQDALI